MPLKACRDVTGIIHYPQPSEDTQSRCGRGHYLFCSGGLHIFSVSDVNTADPAETGAWLAAHTKPVALGLNLVPLTGVAFLWFVGVLRDRLGDREDRFFATVFFGSALLFLAAFFAAAAVLGAIILASTAHPKTSADSDVFHFARATAYNLMNVFAIKMAGVFMVSTSLVTFHTGFVPRWIGRLGIALALVILLGSGHLDWSVLLFPLWVFMASVCILLDNLSPAPSRLAREP